MISSSFIGVGLFNVDPALHQPFVPYGWGATVGVIGLIPSHPILVTGGLATLPALTGRAETLAARAGLPTRRTSTSPAATTVSGSPPAAGWCR